MEKLIPALFIYFFKNEDGCNITINSTRYRAMITDYFLLEIQAYDIWFQQDGATSHTAREA